GPSPRPDRHQPGQSTAQANTRFVPTSRYTPVTAPSFQGLPPRRHHRTNSANRRGPFLPFGNAATRPSAPRPPEAKTRMLSSTTPRSLYRPCRLVKHHVYRYWTALIPASSGPRGGRGP